MINVKDFFSFQNTINSISENEKNQLGNYIAPVKAFARTTNKSIYIIDYQKQGFEFVSENPLFLCGHSAKEIKEMGYEFYLKYVTAEDQKLLLKINQVGFDFYEKISFEEKIKHTITYDFHIINQEGKLTLINQKLTPLFLNEEGKIWKAICFVSLSTASQSGNIKIIKEGDNTIYKYNINGNYWSSSALIELNEREKQILQYSSRGFTINNIAEELFLSSDTVKFHRRNLFEKLEVSNIAEAIAYSFQNKLI